MKSKLILSLVTTLGLVALSQSANAYFRIENGTKNDLSFAVNNVCSSEFGTVKAHEHSLISEDKFFTACKENPHACIAKIYKGAACSGTHQATVLFDIDGGLKTVLKPGPYTYTWNIYNMLISDRV